MRPPMVVGISECGLGIFGVGIAFCTFISAVLIGVADSLTKVNEVSSDIL